MEFPAIITCKQPHLALSYCKSIFLVVMTVKKQDFIGTPFILQIRCLMNFLRLCDPLHR